jgi:hypothetical protein
VCCGGYPASLDPHWSRLIHYSQIPSVDASVNIELTLGGCALTQSGAHTDADWQRVVRFACAAGGLPKLAGANEECIQVGLDSEISKRNI